MILHANMFRVVATALLAATPFSTFWLPSEYSRSSGTHAAADTIVPLDKVAAIVGTTPVLMSDVERQYQLMVSQGLINPDPAAAPESKRAILNQLIDNEILLHFAAIENVEIPADRMEQPVDQKVAAARAQFESEEKFRAALRAEGFNTVNDFREYSATQLRRENIPGMLINSLLRDGRIPRAVVTDAEIAEQMEPARKGIGPKPARVSFRQLIMPTQPSAEAKVAARALADSLLLLLQNKGDFDSLARVHSDDPTTRDLGGDLGWRRRGYFLPEFERWVFTRLQPTQLSPVVETAFGYHLIRVDRVLPAEVKSRHILIKPEVDSSDMAVTRTLADSIVSKLREGASFDSLADKYNSTDANPYRLIADFQVDSLPPNYQEALRGLQAGAVTPPFTTPDPKSELPAFVIAVVVGVDPGGEYTDTELRELIRNQLQETKSIRNYVDKMRTQVYVAIMM